MFTTVGLLGGIIIFSRQVYLMKSKKCPLAAIVVSLFPFFSVNSVVKAQTTIDVEKITCKQFVAFSVADPDQIGIWLSGYFHGKNRDKILHVQDFRKDLAALKSACHLSKNAERPVIKVSEELFPNR